MWEQGELFSVQRDYRNHPKYRSGVFKTKEEIEEEMRNRGMRRIVRVLSFGGGTQSAHLLDQHLRGEVPYDLIIFADTGAEPGFIHRQVKWWMRRKEEMGKDTPFLITRHHRIPGGIEEMVMRYILTDTQRFQLPVHLARVTEDGEEVKAGKMPRQCTVDYKITPVKRLARRIVLERLGLSPKQMMPKDVGFMIDIGFSFDEMHRIQRYQSPQFKYMFLSYPLVEQNRTTEESIRYLREHGMPNKRSRCYLCPFQCDEKGLDWEEIIEEEPVSFLKACWMDEEVRRVQRSGKKVMRMTPYFHASRRPLREVYETEYGRLMERYRKELDRWVAGWKRKLQADEKAAG